METIREAARDIPVVDTCDVLVAGGGPSGVAAAIQAGRLGARVVLVERSGMLGGVATAGLMSHWTGQTKGGLYEEILDRSCDVPEGVAGMGIHGETRQLINHEKLRTVLLSMCVEAKVSIWMYTTVSSPVMDGDRVLGLVVESKNGREAILAAVTIDASGDGDVAAAAGAPFYKGREYDGKMQPMTDMLKIGGVDTTKVRYVPGFEDTYPIPAGDLQTVSRQHLPYPAGHVLIYPSPLPGMVVLNMTNCNKVDGTKTKDLVHAEITCRGQIDIILDFMRKYVPGFEKAYLIQSSAMIGVRETRHFRGEATLTERDIMEARVFDDWVVTKAHFNFDVHNLEGAGLDETGMQRAFRQRQGYTIPYGCLVPLKVEGLLLAGRIISGTHMAHSNFRVMPICVNIGQAAGIAAALCAKEGVQPRSLGAAKIQEVLRGLGVEP